MITVEFFVFVIVDLFFLSNVNKERYSVIRQCLGSLLRKGIFISIDQHCFKVLKIGPDLYCKYSLKNCTKLC